MQRAERQAQTQDAWAGCLLAIAEARDKRSFAELFEYFAPRLKALFMRRGVPGNIAEEIAQDTMLAVWCKAAQYDPAKGSAGTWIYTIARNLHVDARRREREPAALSEAVDCEPPKTPTDDLTAAEERFGVRSALGQLPSEQAEVIRLSFFEEKPHPQIATALNIPVGTVKSRSRLAMKRLRMLVGRFR